MRPIDENGEQWPADAAGLAFEDMRAQCRAALNERDEKLSGGRLNAGNNFSPNTLIGEPGSENSTYLVDAVLSSLKHTGDDMVRLLRSRWATFCSVGRDPSEWVKRAREQSRADQIKAMLSDGEAVEQQLADIAKAGRVVLSADGNVVPTAEMGAADPAIQSRTKPRGKRTGR